LKTHPKYDSAATTPELLAGGQTALHGGLSVLLALTGVALATALSSCRSAPGVDVSEFTAIHLPRQATAVERFVGEELQRHVRLMSDIELPIVAESEAWQGMRICVGRSASAGKLGARLAHDVRDVAEDSFAVVSEPGDVLLVCVASRWYGCSAVSAGRSREVV